MITHPEHAIHANDEEIDLLQLLLTLTQFWKLLSLFFIIGLFLGGVLFCLVKTRYTAQFKVNITKLQPDGSVANQPVNTFILRMRDERAQETANEAFWQSRPSITPKGVLRFYSEIDKKNPETLVLSGVGHSRELAVDFLRFLPDYLSAYFNEELVRDELKVISEVKSQTEEMLDKLQKTNEALTTFDQVFVKQFEQEKKELSPSELEGLYSSCRSIKRQREYLEELLPKLSLSDAEKICDIFVSTCPNLAHIGSASDGDRIWSVVVEFRKLAEAKSTLLAKLDKLPSKDGPEAMKIQGELLDAENKLAGFSDVTIAQLRARKELFLKQEADLHALIEKTLALKNDIGRERIKYDELKGKLDLFKNNYSLISSTLTRLDGRFKFKLEFKVVDCVVDVKSNLKQKMICLLSPPFIMLIMAGVSALLYTAIKQRCHPSRDDDATCKASP